MIRCIDWMCVILSLSQYLSLSLSISISLSVSFSLATLRCTHRSNQAEEDEIDGDVELKGQHELQPVERAVGDVQGVVGVRCVHVVQVA